MDTPPRYLTEQDFKRYIPVHVVWEITLACDLKCMHCGSRAGHKRPDELNTAECLEVVDALARLGTREITLIGGEAYLRKDWTEIIRRICSHDIYVATQTGGRNFTPQRLAEAVDAGLGGLGVSLDGLQPLHDKLRGVSRIVPSGPRYSAAGPRSRLEHQREYADWRGSDSPASRADGRHYWRRRETVADSDHGRDG